MSRVSRALLIGVNSQETTGCERDVERWRQVLTQAAPGPAVAADAVATRVGGAASRAAVLDALQAFAGAVAEDRVQDADAIGLFLFAGPGWASDGWADSGISVADGDLRYRELADVLDAAFPELAAQRDAAAPFPDSVSTPLPSPALLAVLDTATARGPARAGWTSRCVRGPLAPTEPAGTDTRAQPRLRYHARQIAPQGVCHSGEAIDPLSGQIQGEITRWFAPFFAREHARVRMFSSEIGPGTSGFVPFSVRSGGLSLGYSVWAGVNAVRPAGRPLPAWRSRWHMTPFPDEFTLTPLDDAPAGWADGPLILDAQNHSCAMPTQGGADPAWTTVYGVSADPDGATLGYMGFAGPASAPTQQWWAAPFGVVDNHGFFVHSGAMSFQRLAAPPTVPAGWRVVRTL